MSQLQFLDFNGKCALVTGGRRGLGRAMALALAEAGADVAVVGRHSDSGDLQEAMKQFRRHFLYLQCDLADRAARSEIVPKVLREFGHLDILINNAGNQSCAPLDEYSLEQWDSDWSVMVSAAFELSRQSAPGMRERRYGKIINMASISSFQGARNIIGYSTAKHAVVGLTKCLANELAPYGINVNAIAPGIFRTDMAENVFRDATRAAALQSRIPDGRFGEVADIVGPMLFLAGPMSSHVNGHVLLVDGGWMGR